MSNNYIFLGLGDKYVSPDEVEKSVNELSSHLPDSTEVVALRGSVESLTEEQTVELCRELCKSIDGVELREAQQ